VSLSVSGNLLFESAGEELLRLLKVSPADGSGRLSHLDVSSNAFSERLQRRFQSMTMYQLQRLEEDPYNCFSSRFDYLLHMDAIPTTCWKHIEPLWRMMTVSPPQPPNASGYTGDSIPVAATAPLLVNMMRHVYFAMASEVRDPWIRSVFCPVGWSDATSNGPSGSFSACGTTASIQNNDEAQYLQSYTKLLLTTLRIALDAPSRWDDAVQVLRAVGASHQRIGVRPWLYCRANFHLMAAMETNFPSEEFDGDAKASMIQILALQTRMVTAGMDLLG
jgi:hypothetical protein